MEFTRQAVDDRTTLSLIGIKDAGEVFSLVGGSRAYLRLWLPWVDATQSVEDTKEFIKSAMKQYDENEVLHCCIRNK